MLHCQEWAQKCSDAAKEARTTPGSNLCECDPVACPGIFPSWEGFFTNLLASQPLPQLLEVP